MAGLYFFVLSDDTPTEPGATPILPTELVRTDPQQQRQAPPTAQREQRTFVEQQDFGARCYIRDFTIFSLGEIIVNPREAERAFFITTISLEHRQADRRLPQELQAKTSILLDRVQTYFSGLTLDDLRNPDNRPVFRNDIISILNNQLIEGRVTDVLFEQWVIQQ
jgi:hypothetical protein